ncbi:hypothetical protein VNO78_35493 [Psophocarpus tetragonolobus]|uniref:Uncharacterized protein n=1 Tax=Psophocarpus tetragonolobus TaxID=3891 RepID=A0AAN9RL62_PSOTE
MHRDHAPRLGSWDKGIGTCTGPRVGTRPSAMHRTASWDKAFGHAPRVGTRPSAMHRELGQGLIGHAPRVGTRLFAMDRELGQGLSAMHRELGQDLRHGPAMDRGSKATLPLTIPRRIFKSSAKDSTRRSKGIALQGVSAGLIRPARVAKRHVPLGAEAPYCWSANGRRAHASLLARISDLEAFSHNPTLTVASRSLAFQPSAMTNCANQRIKRAFNPFVHTIFEILFVELILGHLRYLLTDVPPQPNSPPDNVFRPDQPTEAGLGSRKRGSAPLPIHGISKITRIPLVRTSSESTVRRPGKRPRRARSQSVPRPARDDRSLAAGAARAVHRQPTGSGLGPPVPSPQSQSFSRGYGSILPTSLAYIVPSTRGCSPWRPDAVMSTTGRGRHSVLQIFKGRRGRTGHHATCGALPAAGPYLRLSRFQGGQAVKSEKITLTGAPADVSGIPNVAVSRHVPICTDGRSARARALGFAATAAPSYSSGPGPCPDGRVSGAVGHRNPASGSSRIASSAYQKWPTWSSRFHGTAQQSSRTVPTYLKTRPQGSSYPEGNFGGNQLLDGSISLSPLYPSMLSLEPFTEGRGRSAVHPQGDPTNQLPCALRVYSPVDSHTCQTPWSVFQDGPNGEPTGRRQEHARAEARPRAHAAIHNRHDDVSASISTAWAWATVAIRIRSVPRVDRRTGSRRSTSDRGTSPTPIRFPPDNFKHSLTLFSKSFSSFPRGTCSLSVSRQYLALDEIYRPIGAAFPNNPTRRQRLVVRQGPGTTGLSPSLAPPSRGLGPGPPLRTLLQTTIRTPEATDSHGGLFPRVAPPDLRSRYERLRDVYKMGHGACPQPNGFGRNLRSKTRWFTGFCNSHQVSHFATFFIDARAEISVAESHFASCVVTTPAGHRLRVPKNRPLQFQFPWHTKRRGSVDFSQRRGQRTAHVAAIRTLHRTIQSVGATGGVYKGQGRSQRELMTRAY